MISRVVDFPFLSPMRAAKLSVSRLVMFIGLIDQAFDFNIIPDVGRVFLSHFSTGFALID